MHRVPARAWAGGSARAAEATGTTCSAAQPLLAACMARHAMPVHSIGILARARHVLAPLTQLLADEHVGVGAVGVVPAAHAQLQRRALRHRAALHHGAAAGVAVVRHAQRPVVVAACCAGCRCDSVHPPEGGLGPSGTCGGGGAQSVCAGCMHSVCALCVCAGCAGGS